MTTFMAVKIHYDHRDSLPPHLKYSKVPERSEYEEYFRRYEDGIGGNGFHECLNFAIPEHANVEVYLPPTGRPDRSKVDDEFVIFSFTYKGDPVMPSAIIGVHAGATIADSPQRRSDFRRIDGIDEPLMYHAEARPELVTLFTEPLPYDRNQGRYTPAFKSWGFGLRYLTPEHARAILADALKGAVDAADGADAAKSEVIARQIDVLCAIGERYFPGDPTFHPSLALPGSSAGGAGVPDQELGYLGENHVYQMELSHALSIGALPSAVEWISQASPQSPFDIKTVRERDGRLVAHFIEVKSSRAADEGNIYLSSRQIEFFTEHAPAGTFAFVEFDLDRNVRSVRNRSVSELLQEFELVPIKYKLRKKDD